jgi:hypothetical protein
MIEHWIEACMALAAVVIALAGLCKAIASVWAQRNKTLELHAAPGRTPLSLCAEPCSELRKLRREFEYYRGLANGRHDK